MFQTTKLMGGNGRSEAREDEIQVGRRPRVGRVVKVPPLTPPCKPAGGLRRCIPGRRSLGGLEERRGPEVVFRRGGKVRWTEDSRIIV